MNTREILSFEQLQDNQSILNEMKESHRQLLKMDYLTFIEVDNEESKAEPPCYFFIKE